VEQVIVLPPPEGVAHVPSPRQKVDEDALVPEFRLVTGRFPVTPPLPEAARLTALILAPATVPEETLEPFSEVILAPLNVGVAEKVGAAVDPVKLPNTLLAAAVDKVKVSAGVVVEVATEVVKSGERVPAENDVTVPLPPPAPQSLPVPLSVPDVLTCRHCVDPVMGSVSVPVNDGDASGAAPVT
jgi:hypothetical protein